MMDGGRYWARAEMHATSPSGEEFHRSYLRGSYDSHDDAQRKADDAALRTRQSIERGDEKIDWYAYCDHTKPEPLLEEIMSKDNHRVGTLTINAYGAHILNTTGVVFIDVDLPKPRKKASGLLSKLFGKKQPPQQDSAQPAIDRLKAYCQEDLSRGARVYKTAAGLRYLLTSETLDPTSDYTRDLFDRLGADQQYTNLCKAQKCFRARLSPKPIRMSVGWPPQKIRADREQTPELSQWEKNYTNECPKYAVCHLIETIGPPPQHPDIIRIQSLHDELSSVGSELTLA
jgi:hypothetical protein